MSSGTVVNLLMIQRFMYQIAVCVYSGYGHSTPATMSGKAFCIAYAIVGIPLGIFMFQSIGERLNKLISIIIGHAKVNIDAILNFLCALH